MELVQRVKIIRKNELALYLSSLSICLIEKVENMPQFANKI